MTTNSLTDSISAYVSGFGQRRVLVPGDAISTSI